MGQFRDKLVDVMKLPNKNIIKIINSSVIQILSHITSADYHNQIS